jgi:ABC-type multidrug transport system fused ATPase/permease subunit
MVVPKGKSVGIIGPSGAGKSTVVDIILGLLHVQSGEILCDGSNIFSNYDSWLAQIGYIPQNIYLIDDSLKNNVAWGVNESSADENKVWQALADAQIADFVKESEKGLEMDVGERGTRISGGQRQRLGIARALYRNPQVLVFDEATSALDNETEKEVMKAIESLQGTRTMIMIAHRLTTVEKCDIIFRVENGKVEQISHDELFKSENP